MLIVLLQKDETTCTFVSYVNVVQYKVQNASDTLISYSSKISNIRLTTMSIIS